ncbi:sterile alpha motif domain-containing protein 9-like [Oncorhynchus keta]|uniref:sterile alpha motif domain-containing protein 9-like n=1 Tax=Oncorhynchus keta TaxID=8018 RepID=UPI00227AD93E|nr:sterile alpha motif domain-containing protein 9-like [Oncorhynchus keta]
MNMRSNGTIHFGVMDKATGIYTHGEIIGIPVENQDSFVDALDYIEHCFKGSTHPSDARSCIRNPKFIEFSEKANKVIYEEKAPYHRRGSEEKTLHPPHMWKKYMDDSLFYIIVTNKLKQEHLENINFLTHMNIFCTWIKTKKKQLKRTVSVICNEILPPGSFVVVFLLMSHIEQPLADTFHEFYAEMNDKKHCGEVIQRDAYRETNNILEDILQGNSAKRSIETVNICHQAGSGGSTVARQILWNWKAKLRCAVVKQSHEITTVCEHVVHLREYEERDKNSCLPVLLLLEDCNAEYRDDLRRELGNAITTKKISASVLCFILLICKRSHDPERMCRALPSQTVAVTHKLTDEEKTLFSKKLERLKLKFEPEFILTFVLMSEGFPNKLHRGFCEESTFVALLNCYVQDSYISVSHCEASLALGIQVDRIRYHAFENFSQ